MDNHTMPENLADQLGGNGFRFHHVGIIVRDLAAAAETYRLLGFRPGHEEMVAAQGVRVVLVSTGEPDQYIELFTPLGAGRLADFLAARGEGMHHVAFAVDDIAAALGQLRANGVRLVDATPRAGAHGWSVAFLHPASAHGVLIELVQEQSAVGSR
ncbi:MAG TPA: methylmalonyl-CoA epimerase [Thermomicrobiales bacterium]|jgi:methylmalonyl-CoA epimerase